MKTVYQTRLYNFHHDEENNVLIFDWTEATADMNDQDFMDALSNYAGFAFELNGPGLLVDVVNFKHSIGDEAMKWRNESALPRYMAAGSYKMGYVLPPPAMSQVPQGDVVHGEFMDHYFDNRVAATEWLTS